MFAFKHIAFVDKKVACIFFSGGGWRVARGGKQLATPTISAAAAAADTPSMSFHPSSVVMVRRARETI